MNRARVGVGLVTSLAFTACAGSPGVIGGPGDPVRGEQVFVAQKCSVCHKIGDRGGPLGPELTSVGSKRSAAWLATYLPNPTAIDPENKTKMPPTRAKGVDLDDLVAYLLTLRVR